MKVTGVSMVRDEADVVAGTLRHMAQEVDDLIVADNLSTDGTRDILNQLARELPLTVIDDPDPAYYQSRKMTALAELAASRGATWIVPFDADELWTFNHGDAMIATVLASLHHDDVATAQLINYFPTALDPAGSDPFQTIQWRLRRPAGLQKVAIKWRHGMTIDQGNHDVSCPGRLCHLGGVLRVNHFPYRSADQFVRKGVQGGRAYALTDLPDSSGAHWRGYHQIYETSGRETLAGVFREHFWFLDPERSDLLHEPASYHGAQR